MKRLLALGVLTGLAFAPPALAGEQPPPAVAVTGEGTVTATPDLATITSGVVSRAPTPGAALKANAAAMNRLFATLKDAKIEDRDVATSGLSLQPQYDYGSDGSGSRTPKLVAYEVRNRVSIRLRDVGRLGEFVDALVQSGSNAIDGLSFDVSNRDARLDEARRAAIADARRKAELYAASAGVKLGALLSIDEAGEGADDPAPPTPLRAKAMADSATPIARGEQELAVRVQARWAIQP